MGTKTRFKFGLLTLIVIIAMAIFKADSSWGIHIVTVYAIYVGGKSFTNKVYMDNGKNK